MSNNSTIQMIYDNSKSWGDGEGSYTEYYHCPIGEQQLSVDFDCTPGFGEVDGGFCNPKCYEGCKIIKRNIKSVTISQDKPCPFIKNT